MPKKPQRLGKKDFLAHFAGLQEQGPQPLEPTPVPYKHEGSTYAQDGIRITGSREWIDAVLSRLTELLGAENQLTRLQVNYTQATDKQNNPIDSWVCYLQVHERGGEAQMANVLSGTILSRGY
jgi:hypothetical protein